MKASVKYLIASDIHGSAFWCRSLLDAFKKEEADILVLLGDILYHGPRNQLPEEYDPAAVAAMLNSIYEDIISVKGNCEAEVDQMLLKFPALSEQGFILTDVIRTDSKGREELLPTRLYLSHGHVYGPEHPLPMPAGSILLTGHTHVPHDIERDGIRYLNPGSVSIPKQDSGHGYLLLSEGRFERKLLQGSHE